MLWGPPGGAKSTIATCLKRGLEAWSNTDDGAVYALAGCPKHDEPLHLVPNHGEPDGPTLRDRLRDYTGVDVEGDLCPVCRLRLDTEFDGDPERFPITRIRLSESRRIGIGTFAPSDPKSMSTEQLTGGVNFKLLETYGSDDDPRAQRGPSVPALPGRHALHNVRVSDEARIHTKLLAQSDHDFHIDPQPIAAASSISVMTCLTEFPNLSSVEKMHLYDGRETGEFKLNQVSEIMKGSRREGLEGIDPRFVIDALSRAVAGTEHDADPLEPAEPLPGAGSRPCLTAVMALRALRSSIERSQQIDEEAKKRYLALVTEARQEIDRNLKDEVRRAFVPAFADTAQELLENYLNHCEAYCTKRTVQDPVTDEEIEPDEKLLRGVEEMIGVTDNAKDTFRAGVLMRIGMWMRKGRPLAHNSDDQLGQATLPSSCSSPTTRRRWSAPSRSSSPGWSREVPAARRPTS